MATTTEAQPVHVWEKIKIVMSRGMTPYALMTAYAIFIPWLAITSMKADPRPSLYTDILFVLFLGIFLLLHKLTVLARVYRLVVGLLLLLFVMPYFGTFNQFYMDVMIQAGMFVVLALGLNIVVGFAGLLDLGYIAFYAVGAYLWAIFSSSLQVTGVSNTPQIVGTFQLGAEWFFVFLPLALVLGAIMGMLLGLPVLRLRGGLPGDCYAGVR